MKNAKRATWLGISGITICSLCCVLPIIGAGIGMASLAAIACSFQKISFAALGLMLTIVMVTWYRKRTEKTMMQTNTCSIGCKSKQES